MQRPRKLVIFSHLDRTNTRTDIIDEIFRADYLLLGLWAYKIISLGRANNSQLSVLH